MNFGDALVALKAGKHVRRAAWATPARDKVAPPDKRRLALLRPQGPLPVPAFIGLCGGTSWTRWTVDHDSLLAEDWEVVE